MTNNLLAALAAILLLPLGASAQTLYFPPTTGNNWDTVSAASLGWCEDSIPPLLQMLDETNSKAFIVLKDGKIVIEAYFDDFGRDSLWYWASAGKGLTAFLVGLAQEQGHLNIHDKTSDYLGQGWTIAPQAKEDSITIWHQLTMTSGLDDGVPENFCTLDTCLQYLADAGTRWAYHNGPYTLLDPVIVNATGMTLNQYNNQQLKQKTGMTGNFVPVDYNNVYFSNARSMARFGLLNLNRGKWDQEVIMTDTAYYNAMVNTSQNINPSYGYLWWLNGKSSYMLPQSQFSFSTLLIPNAPADTYSALGRDGQIINVVPSMGLVVIRMGESPGQVLLVSNAYSDDIWERLLPIFDGCNSTGTAVAEGEYQPSIYPNPTTGQITFSMPQGAGNYLILFNVMGQKVMEQVLSSDSQLMDVSHLPKGMYLYQVSTSKGTSTGNLVLE